MAQTVTTFVTHASAIQRPAVATGCLTLVAAVLWQPLNRLVPAMLVAVVTGSVVAVFASGSEPTLALRTVDALPSAIPPLSAPDLAADTLRLLLVPSIAMTLLALAEGRVNRPGPGKTPPGAAGRQSGVPRAGLANVIGAFFSSYPASGSFNRSGVNIAAGASTPLSAICAAGFLVLILLFVAPLALPAAGGGGSHPVSGGMESRGSPRVRYLLSDKFERVTLVSTFVATLVIPLEWAILLGWRSPLRYGACAPGSRRLNKIAGYRQLQTAPRDNNGSRFHARTARPRCRERLRHSSVQRQQP